MTDQALDLLKLALLLLLYLFFARVLWAVWSEVRQPVERRQAAEPNGLTPTGPTGRPEPRPSSGPAPRSGRRRRGAPSRLVVVAPKERRGTTFHIIDGLGIGREPDNTVVISGDAYVSGHHAKLTMRDGGILVEDLASRNGTVVNGSRLVRPHQLRTGDRIQIGYTVLEAT